MTRSHQFVIDFEYIINQGFETSSSVSHIPLNMELKASMYPPNAKISDFPNCNTPDNIPEPLAEIERNKIRENRLKNRKRLSAGCYSNNNK
uniref:BZIP domain-containing protein n=1 Tax=Parastrongyloides trichosuri TaxID=131310 RepID=A0A0N4ZNB0_PARTI